MLIAENTDQKEKEKKLVGILPSRNKFLEILVSFFFSMQVHNFLPPILLLPFSSNTV